MKVELISHTPNPVEVCSRAAGISYDREEREDHEAFIQRIVSMGHESVIEHAKFTFRIEGISRACSHQFVRHRICSFTQRSQRYVDEGDADFIVPSLDYIEDNEEWKMRKDISLGESRRENLKMTLKAACNHSIDAYRFLRSEGVRAEDARFVLPNACETKIVWTANAREIRHFLKLRLHETAQWEIREMAKKVFDIVVIEAPVLFEDLKMLRDTGVGN